MDVTVQHDTENQEFTADLNGEQAELAYATPQPNLMDFTHTYVPKGERNKGVAARLIEAGLQYAEQQGHKVIASCPAVAKFIRTHENYQRLLL
jgi:predicted GNAT family acetyltransferase